MNQQQIIAAQARELNGLRMQLRQFEEGSMLTQYMERLTSAALTGICSRIAVEEDQELLKKAAAAATQISEFIVDQIIKGARESQRLAEEAEAKLKNEQDERFEEKEKSNLILD